MNEDPVYIFFDGESRSLRATRKIRQGETICDIPNRVRPNPNKYSIQMAPGAHADCDNTKCGAINHSCKPNAAVRNWRIVAWACIEPGEQVTIDYKKTETNLAAPFKCGCGHCGGDFIE